MQDELATCRNEKLIAPGISVPKAGPRNKASDVGVGDEGASSSGVAKKPAAHGEKTSNEKDDEKASDDKADENTSMEQRVAQTIEDQTQDAHGEVSSAYSPQLSVGSLDDRIDDSLDKAFET